MAGQLRRYCNLTQFIEKTDPKLYGVLEAICMLGTLRPRREHTGLTFIYPLPATVEALQRKVDEDAIEEVVEVVLAHIVHDFIPTPAKWEEYKTDVTTGHMTRLPVKVTGKTVAVAGGVKIAHDEKFRQFVSGKREVNQVVWRIEGKEDIKYDPSYERSELTFVKARSEHKETKGGALGRPITDRTRYIHHQLDKYVSAVFNPSPDDARICNPLIEDIVSYLHYLRARHPDRHDAVLQHLTPAPVASFIFLFSSVPQAEFETWMTSGRIPVDGAVTAYHACLNMELKVADPAASIVADATDITRADYGSKFKRYYEAVAAARGGTCTAAQLYGLHFGSFWEATHLAESEMAIAAVRVSGRARTPETENTFRADVRYLHGIVCDPDPIVFKTASKSLTADCVDMLMLFRYSDLWGWRVHPVEPLENGSQFQLRGDGDDAPIAAARYLKWRNVTAYINTSRDYDVMIGQIVALVPQDKRAKLIAALGAV